MFQKFFCCVLVVHSYSDILSIFATFPSSKSLCHFHCFSCHTKRHLLHKSSGFSEEDLATPVAEVDV